MNKFFCFLFLASCYLNLLAQQYNFINYSIEDGLVQSQIKAICQDADGYIWIGTLGGVSRFDGINFKNYSVEDGLLNNQVNAIFKGTNEKIWLGSLGGFSIYDGKTFKSFQFNDTLSKKFVLSITEDTDGNMWLATSGGGVVYYNHKEFKYIQHSKGEGSNYVRNIVCDRNNNKWLATKGGVIVIDSNLNFKDTLPNINATQIFIEENQAIWCSTFGTGVWKITKDSLININRAQGLISNHIRGLTKRKDGSFWFVSKSGVSKYLNGEIKNFTIQDGLMNENIKCLIEDIEGNLFFGSDGGGLIKFTNEDFIAYTKKEGLSSNVVMSIIQDGDSNLWFSTYGNGICKKTKDQILYYTEEDGLGNNTVWCSLLDKNNNIWFGTSDGVSVFDGSSWKTYNADNGLNSKKIYALNQDTGEDIWIGAREGIFKLSLDEDTIHKYMGIEGLHRNVRCIYNDDSNTWFCSSDGLFRYNFLTGENIKFTVNEGLPHNSTMSIIKDQNGILWVGTISGLCYFYNERFNVVELPDNYASKNINFLSVDKYNNLWIGTNFGLYQLYIKESLQFKKTDFVHYSNLDGLKSLECNQNASFIDHKNNLWFGTSKGLMKHSLSSQADTSLLPQVKLTAIRLFFEEQDWSNYSNRLESNANLPKDLVLKYNKNHLTFDFVGIHHTNADKVKYKFKLEGFDEDWQPVTEANFVTYSNIPFGEFSFKLSATANAKDWTVPITFRFKINPPFWFTWWFYMLVFICLIALIWLIINRAEKVAQRKRNTQLIVDKSKMLSLEQQALNASMNRHFIFNALNSIQYYINRQDKYAANKYLTSFAKLVRKNLDSSLENEIYIDEEIERIDLYIKLEQMRFQDKFKYQIKMDKNIEPHTIKIPSMLLQPFIENSIWHGILPLNKPGNIAVEVKKLKTEIVINIIDDGIGIEKSLALKKDKEQHHVSKGMELTKGRINLVSKISDKKCFINGPDQIYDEKNEVIGTKVSIVLPLLQENNS